VYVDVVSAPCGTFNPVTSTRIFTVLAGSSVAENEMRSCTISPNPFNQFIKVTGASVGAQYRLIALDGTLVDWQGLENGEIETASLAQGLYLLEIRTGQGVFRQKVQKVQ
jgi:hypothetical protein